MGGLYGRSQVQVLSLLAMFTNKINKKLRKRGIHKIVETLFSFLWSVKIFVFIQPWTQNPQQTSHPFTTWVSSKGSNSVLFWLPYQPHKSLFSRMILFCDKIRLNASWKMRGRVVLILSPPMLFFLDMKGLSSFEGPFVLLCNYFDISLIMFPIKEYIYFSYRLFHPRRFESQCKQSIVNENYIH